MKVVFESSAESVYLTVIVILMVLQVYQFYIYKKMVGTIDKLWNTLTTISLSISLRITEIEKKLEDGTKK